MNRRYDAHVRARRRLITRICNLGLAWGMSWARASNARHIAARKLANYCAWGWLPQFARSGAKDVPLLYVRSIMCTSLSAEHGGER